MKAGDSAKVYADKAEKAFSRGDNQTAQTLALLSLMHRLESIEAELSLIRANTSG